MTTFVYEIPVTYGTVSGSPITGDCLAGTLDKKQTVTLSANYVRAPPAGEAALDG